MKKALTHKLLSPQSRPRFTLPAKVVGVLTLMSLAAGFGLLAPRPGHTAGGPVSVSVANTPLATTAADDPAKQPFQATVVLTNNGNPFTDFPTVPAGKRLVVESISIFSNVPSDTHSHNIILQSRLNGFYHDVNLPTSTVPYSGVSEKLLIYIEAGGALQAFCQTSGNATPNLYVTATGHYVNVP